MCVWVFGTPCFNQKLSISKTKSEHLKVSQADVKMIIDSSQSSGTVMVCGNTVIKYIFMTHKLTMTSPGSFQQTLKQKKVNVFDAKYMYMVGIVAV